MIRTINRGLAVGVMLWCAAATSAQPRPVVVELFTSQGCSSCPPADAYVATLSARPEIVALSFHVGYWDDLGWRDRFALPASVERQNNYARKLHHSSVYTPQLVVDGREDDFRSDGKMVARALSQNRDGVPVGVSVHDAEIQVDIGATRWCTQRCNAGGVLAACGFEYRPWRECWPHPRGVQHRSGCPDARPVEGRDAELSSACSLAAVRRHRRRGPCPAVRAGSDYRSRRSRTALIELTSDRTNGQGHVPGRAMVRLI